MTTEDDLYYVERPDTDQFLFSSPKKTAAWMGGILVLFAIFLAWFYSRPGSALHGATGAEKLGLAIFVLLVLAIAGWNFYIAIVGRSFLIDGKTKLVSKNGERLTGFGGVSAVDLAVGYYPSISPTGHSYALSLRLKSGDSVTLTGLIWRRWYEFSDSDEEKSNNEAAADRLDEIAGEIATLIGVRVSKGAR